MTTLRQRMVEDLERGNQSPHTLRRYVRTVGNLAKFFDTSPDRLGPKHTRDYQLLVVHRNSLGWNTGLERCSDASFKRLRSVIERWFGTRNATGVE